MLIDKSIVMKSFNTHFFEFIDDIIAVFPDNMEIIKAKKALEILRQANPAMLIKVWQNRVNLPYIKEIQNGDITFFFEKNYETDIKMSNSENVLQIIDNIREPVRTMSDVNRSHTMNYIQNLSKLSNMYFAA